MERDQNKILLFNPRSATHNYRLPNSVLQIASSVAGEFDFVIVDGNLETDPWNKIQGYLSGGGFRYFACTVMPGPQLKQAIPITRRIHEKYSSVVTIWGGYFPSIHTETSIRSGFVDFLVRGCGDTSFPELIRCLADGKETEIGEIPNLVFLDGAGNIIRTPQGRITDMDSLPILPYDRLHDFYDVNRYIPKTWIGRRTFSYHSSFGCPFDCAFCGVASVFRSEWNGRSAGKVYQDLEMIKERYHIDAVEFFDSNFFASPARVLEFCSFTKKLDLRWWAEGRIDTLDRYTNLELRELYESGCRLVFMGAESGSDTVLESMNKGGKLTREMTEKLVARFREAGIIPELSFVLGFPSPDPGKVRENIRNDISFIRKLKKINPQAEIVIYVYSPIPSLGTSTDNQMKEAGFEFPQTLDEWLMPEREQLELRKNPGTPWLAPEMIRYIKDFETVLNAAFPGVSNIRMTQIEKIMLKGIGKIRYRLRWYRFPVLLKFLLRWMKYRLPETEGF